MHKHTKRVVGILKEVLADINKQEEKGVEMGDVLAYTANTAIPNITKHDVEMLVLELECECTHPNGMLTDGFAAETCCPDELITFTEGGKHVAINCQPICVHHSRHMEWAEFNSDEEVAEEILKGR